MQAASAEAALLETVQAAMEPSEHPGEGDLGETAPGLGGVAPVRQPTAARGVVERILAIVTAGDLAPGDKLPPERELAERFQVSRATMREALAALSVLGVVRARQGGGIYVSELEAADLLSPLTFFLTLRGGEVAFLYAARRLVEGEIARLAAPRIGADDLRALAALIARQRSLRHDPAACRDAGAVFHRRLAGIAGNVFLARMAAGLSVLGREVGRAVSEAPGMADRSIADHEEVLAALEAADAAAAEQAMHRHMDHLLVATKSQRVHGPAGGSDGP